MKKTYKLINIDTKEFTICEKIVIFGFDYYLTDNPKTGDFCYNIETKEYFKVRDDSYVEGLNKNINDKKIIATNNTNLNMPHIIDEVKMLANKQYMNDDAWYDIKLGYIIGYNKRAETHKWTDEDMVEFADWVLRMKGTDLFTTLKTELLQLFEDQQPKILYYK